MKLSLSKRGFTLIELLIVIVVLGVLATAVMIAINPLGMINSANLAKAKTFAASVENLLSISQVGKWSFEEGSGTTVKDTSGYGNNGTLSGGATWQTSNQCGLGFGGCLNFGGNGYVDAGNNSSVNFGLGSFTIAAWIKTSDASASKTIVDKGYNGGTSARYYMRIEATTGKLLADIGDGAVSASVTGTTVLHDGKWHFTTMVVDRATQIMKIYVDGANEGSVSVSSVGNINIVNPPIYSLLFGNMANTSYYFVGLIDEVAIYSQALTAQNIHQLYVQGLSKHQLANK